MRYNSRPVMAEYNYRQEVPQGYVYHNPESERQKGFITCFSQITDPRGKPDT